MIKRMGKFDWCAVIEKQWCNLWKRQNVLSLQYGTVPEDLRLDGKTFIWSSPIFGGKMLRNFPKYQGPMQYKLTRAITCR